MIAAIIPARYASSRLPGKPLLRETGKYLIQHVYEQVKRARSVDRVIVATDDDRIRQAVQSFHGEVMMTREDHASGTDRVAEVAHQLKAKVIINVQGDEPQIEPEAIDQLASLMSQGHCQMATLAVPIRDRHLYDSPHCVKVVCDDQGRALYFSRSPIPHIRDGNADFASDPPVALQHLGIYAYRRDFLLGLAQHPVHPLESFEKLEQLRVLGMGVAISVGVVSRAARGIDTPEDYAEFVQAFRANSARQAA